MGLQVRSLNTTIKKRTVEEVLLNALKSEFGDFNALKIDSIEKNIVYIKLYKVPPRKSRKKAEPKSTPQQPQSQQQPQQQPQQPQQPQPNLFTNPKKSA